MMFFFHFFNKKINLDHTQKNQIKKLHKKKYSSLKKPPFKLLCRKLLDKNVFNIFLNIFKKI
jgi:hypothetical protein